jgi:hypothetical protein
MGKNGVKVIVNRSGTGALFKVYGTRLKSSQWVTAREKCLHLLGKHLALGNG